MKVKAYFAFCVGLFAVLGCSTESLIPVSGTVCVDGQPVEAGIISFEALDGATAVAGAEIKSGKYSTEVPPGEKIVKIRGSRLEAHTMTDDLSKKTFDVQRPIRITHQDYELNSPLRASITKSGAPVNFDLPGLAPSSAGKNKQ
ncbi:MAG: hypothetical protein ACRC46_10240 [Thermoguttaceae bacterium]